MVSAAETAYGHPVNPVDPVKSSSSLGKVVPVIPELLCSVPPRLRGESLPTFLTHTHDSLGTARRRSDWALIPKKSHNHYN